MNDHKYLVEYMIYMYDIDNISMILKTVIHGGIFGIFINNRERRNSVQNYMVKKIVILVLFQ